MDRRYVYGGIVAAVVVGFFLLDPVRIVGPGSRGILMNFSSVQPGVLSPGLHMVVPVMQSVVQMDVQVQNYQNKEEAASRDLQTVHTEVATNYHIEPDDAAWVYQHIGTLPQVEARVIAPAISNAVKAATAHYDAADLIVQRDKVALEIDTLLRKALEPYRVVIDAVNITDFQFSQQFTAAIEAKQVAQQQAQQAAFTLAKVRVDAQQQVLQAQAHADGAGCRGRGTGEGQHHGHGDPERVDPAAAGHPAMERRVADLSRGRRADALPEHRPALIGRLRAGVASNATGRAAPGPAVDRSKRGPGAQPGVRRASAMGPVRKRSALTP